MTTVVRWYNKDGAPAMLETSGSVADSWIGATCMDSIPLPTFPPAIPGKVYIYALVDPRTEEVRYVGKALDIRARLLAHLTPFGLSRKTPKVSWLKSLKSLGLRPSYRVLAVVDVADWETAERFHIAEQRSLGARLTNSTDGGDGSSGYTPSEETRRLRAQTLTGQKRSLETRQRMSAAQRGRVISEETRRLLAAANTGKVASIETRQKMAASQVGRKMPADAIRRSAEKRKGQKRTPEMVEKVAAKLRGRTQSAESVARRVESIRLTRMRKKESAQLRLFV